MERRAFIKDDCLPDNKIMAQLENAEAFKGTLEFKNASLDVLTNNLQGMSNSYMINKLSNTEIETKIQSLNVGIEGLWIIKNERLNKSFKFNNFVNAFDFMTKVAALAESLNHHPEWSNVYNNVEINLTTHEANGISQRDFDLALLIESL